MAISDKLYQLRKKEGLSQEQLAEKLNVSRQAVSKWESGTSIPESEKLIAISDFFGVSLDYLLKDEESVERQTVSPKKGARRGLWLLGLIVCICSGVCFLVWGLIFLFKPTASEQIGGSSAITVDGNGILCLVCMVAVVVGAILLWKGLKKK